MRVLITYEYFLPAYKAGGPVQSINNTAALLAHLEGVEAYILCSNSDLDGTVSDVVTNKWVEYKQHVRVFYNSSVNNKKGILNIIQDVQPDVIFINGLYSLPYTIYPLFYNGGARKVLSVRGMLHPGALSQKSFKKRLFLSAFKLMGLHKRCEYHATTEEEVGYIQNELGNREKVWMVPNLPNVLDYIEPIRKQPGSVMLVSVSLISPMKNILLVLEALKDCSAEITYHIYGPVKDSNYWNECLSFIQTMPVNIKVEYKGEIQPMLVNKVLKDYHYFILPSKSENFGHAIYEALSAGRPVVTSNNTPWNGLEEANAGYNINPEDTEALSALLDELATVSVTEYNLATHAAKKYIGERYNIDKIKEQYKKMFSL